MQRRLVGAGLMRRNPDGVLFFVSAGAGQTLTSTLVATLAGTAATGGKPPYTYKWTVISGPVGSSVVFSDDTSLTSTATLSDGAGSYVLRLRATDANGRTTDSYVTITASLTTPAVLGTRRVVSWDSELGIALAGGAFVDTWTDQIAGKVVSAAAAVNRPPYGPDGTRFNSHNLVQCGQLLNLSSLDLGVLVPAGARPYIFAVLEINTLAVEARLWQLNASAGADDQQALFLPSLNRQYTNGTNQDQTVSLTVANGPSFLEFWLNASSGLNFARNGVAAIPLATATAGTDKDIKQVNFATIGTGLGTNGENAWFAYFEICSSEPTAAQRAVLLAWARATYGTP